MQNYQWSFEWRCERRSLQMSPQFGFGYQSGQPPRSSADDKVFHGDFGFNNWEGDWYWGYYCSVVDPEVGDIRPWYEFPELAIDFCIFRKSIENVERQRRKQKFGEEVCEWGWRFWWWIKRTIWWRDQAGRRSAGCDLWTHRDYL